MSATDDDRTRLGRAVKRAREALRLSIDGAAEAARMSPVTWSNVEQGKRVRDLTYAGIERALGWTSGSVDSILDGGAEVPSRPQPARSGRLPADFSLRDEYERIRSLTAISWEAKFDLLGDVIDLYEQDQAEQQTGREARPA